MAPRAPWRRWLPVEVYPIAGIVVIAVGGASWYLYRLSQGSEVVWDRKGDWRPWDKVKYDQNQKLFTTNREFWDERKVKATTRTNDRYVDQI